MAFSSPLALSRSFGAALQAAEGIGQKVAQGVGGDGQLAQFVFAVAGDTLANWPWLSWATYSIRLANRLDQVAVDQPQARAGRSTAREASMTISPSSTVRSALALISVDCSAPCLRSSADQCAHLLAGGTVDALTAVVAGAGVATGSHEGIAALLVGGAQLVDVRHASVR